MVKRVIIVGVILAALAGCGPSQAARDRVAVLEAEARVEQEAVRAEASRELLGRVGLGLGLAVVAVGVGCAGRLASPLLAVALEVRSSKRLEVSLEVGPGGYVAHLLAEGIEGDELARVLAGAPALDAPRVLELRDRVGDRGLRLLADRGELGESLERLPGDRVAVSSGGAEHSPDSGAVGGE